MNKSEIEIYKLLKEMHIPLHLKGHRCLVESLKLSMENPDLLDAVTKELYPRVADTFKTSPGAVERSIRVAVQRGWEDMVKEESSEYVNINDVPTNRQLLINLITTIRMNQE